MPTFSLYLIRHGVAEERGEEYPDDSKRPLTAQGISRLRKEAQALDELGVTIDQIITSPLLRTRQTADVIAESLKGKPAVVTSDALSPAGTPGAVMQDLAKHAKKGSVALVGPRAEPRRAGGETDWRAHRARVQEGRRLPHRLRDIAAQGQRQAPLVRHARGCCASSVDAQSLPRTNSYPASSLLTRRPVFCAARVSYEWTCPPGSPIR